MRTTSVQCLFDPATNSANLSRQNRRNDRVNGSKHHIRIVLYHLLIVAGLVFSSAPPVLADVLQISGTGLVRHCPCAFDPADSAQVSEGVLQPQDSNTHYFYSVMFPRNGESVCRLSMIYRDVNNNDTMVASLKRKAFQVGGDAFTSPRVMAKVQSASGVVDTVRRATTTNIKRPVINGNRYFYFLEVEVPTINLEILGFQIEVKPTC